MPVKLDRPSYITADCATSSSARPNIPALVMFSPSLYSLRLQHPPNPPLQRTLEVNSQLLSEPLV